MKKGVFASGLAGLFLFAASASAQGVPHPVDYVRVCDAYGAGFLYIPGTETCLDPSTGETRWETPDGTAYGETELRQRLDSIESRINKAFAEQASVAAALADPDLVAGEHFGLRVNCRAIAYG
jgi:hypothetical protein